MATQTGQKYSLAMYFVHAHLKHFIARGYDLNALLERSRIPSNLLESGQARISAQQFARLQSNVMLMMGDEAEGFTDNSLPVGSWNMMCHACITAETLGEALERYCAFYNLIDWGMTAELSLQQDKVVFTLRATKGVAFERLPYATCLLFTHRFCSWLIERFVPVIAFRFACPKPDHHREYRGMFVQSPTLFDQEAYSLEFQKKYLASPVTQDVLSLRRFLRHPIYEMMILDYDTELWSAKVRKIIERDLSQPPDFCAVAEELGIHQQALRRRLAEEDTSYRDMKNKVRFDTAIYYLGKPDLSVEKVSERAGFSEASAFVRAFKGWTGLSPDQYRKRSTRAQLKVK